MKHIWGYAIATLALALAVPAAAEAPIVLQWQDLMPPEQPSAEVPADGIVQHGALTPVPESFAQVPLVSTYNGLQVRLPGYVLPLEFDGSEVREFLLVPYVGACIHVPPPPANQIVYVTSEDSVPVGGMFEPVWVTGLFHTAAIANELADIGYQIEAVRVEPYE